MTKTKSIEKELKKLLTLENWRIQRNIKYLEFVGFKATFNNPKEEFKPSELDKKFKTYLESPAMKNKE